MRGGYRHCERSAAVHAFESHGLPRFARNDEEVARNDEEVARSEGSQWGAL